MLVFPKYIQYYCISSFSFCSSYFFCQVLFHVCQCCISQVLTDYRKVASRITSRLVTCLNSQHPQSLDFLYSNMSRFVAPHVTNRNSYYHDRIEQKGCFHGSFFCTKFGFFPFLALSCISSLLEMMVYVAQQQRSWAVNILFLIMHWF